MPAGSLTQRVRSCAGLLGTRRRNARILVIGLGNLLLRDDGVGVHAIRRLMGQESPGCQYVEVGTAVLDALHLLEEADKVLAIDALQAGGTPGTVYAARLSDIAAPISQASLHELNLLAALPLLRRQPEIFVLGVEPAVIEFGLSLSAHAEAAVPVVMAQVERMVSDWRKPWRLVHNSRHGTTPDRSPAGEGRKRTPWRRLQA